MSCTETADLNLHARSIHMRMHVLMCELGFHLSERTFTDAAFPRACALFTNRPRFVSKLLTLPPCISMQQNTFPWHPEALELAARCGVPLSSASTSVLAAVLVLCTFLGVWGRSTVNTLKFYWLGVPAAAQHFLKMHTSGVAVVNVWRAGRVAFIARC